MRLMSAPSILHFTRQWGAIRGDSFRFAWDKMELNKSGSREKIQGFREKKNQLGLRVDTSSHKPWFIKFKSEGNKKRCIVTVEYKGKASISSQFSKSEGNSVSEISVRPESNLSFIRRVSTNSEGTHDRKFYNEFMNTESEFGYTSTQLIIRRVDSTYNGCEIESPTDLRRKLFSSEAGSSPKRNSGTSY